jgi:tetratricopeptide (TPR) repeat protein
MAAREPNSFDAESCRLLSLAAIEQNPPDINLGEVWRTRALVRFTLIGWHEGVGAVLLARAFGALSIENGDYPDGNGKTLDVMRGSSAAVDILDEIVSLMDAAPSGIRVGTRSLDKDLLERFYYEKRGFFLLALGRLDDARASYVRAAEVAAAAGSKRGQVKVRLGRALVEYASGSREVALAETRVAVDDARTLGEDDLVKTGEQNLTVMERGGIDLHPYEIL